MREIRCGSDEYGGLDPFHPIQFLPIDTFVAPRSKDRCWATLPGYAYYGGDPHSWMERGPFITPIATARTAVEGDDIQLP